MGAGGGQRGQRQACLAEWGDSRIKDSWGWSQSQEPGDLGVRRDPGLGWSQVGNLTPHIPPVLISCQSEHRPPDSRFSAPANNESQPPTPPEQCQQTDLPFLLSSLQPGEPGNTSMPRPISQMEKLRPQVLYPQSHRDMVKGLG